MADTSAKPGSVGGLGAASRRPPRGLPRGSPGAGLATRPAVSRDVAPREPRGRAMPGRRDATRAPSVEELSVPAPPSPDIRRTLKSPVNTPIAAARTRREPVDELRIGPSVGRLSERNNAQ
jgi:hypothetical protein